VEEVIDQVGLGAAAGRRVKGYSLGMRQRLGIGAALLGDPQVLLFDEPVNGLDLDGVRWIRSLLRGFADEGRTVLVSSHLMSEMQLIADRVVIIGRGRLIADRDIGEVLDGLEGHRVSVRSPQADDLHRALTEGAPPTDVTVERTAPDELEVYVTDNFMYGAKFDQVPPLNELDQRVRRYRLRFDADGRVGSEYLGAFGDTSEQSALRVVESIAGDAAGDRLLIADEDLGHGSTLREYSLAGRATGRALPAGSFAAQAEGVALWSCARGAGYWIAVDQLDPQTVFHVFERDSLRPVGSFRGERTAHTDGIAVHAAATRAFPYGALYAVDDDRSVAAFDLGEVARALQLQSDCLD